MGPNDGTSYRGVYLWLDSTSPFDRLVLGAIKRVRRWAVPGSKCALAQSVLLTGTQPTFDERAGEVSRMFNQWTVAGGPEPFQVPGGINHVMLADCNWETFNKAGAYNLANIPRFAARIKRCPDCFGVRPEHHRSACVRAVWAFYQDCEALVNSVMTLPPKPIIYNDYKL